MSDAVVLTIIDTRETPPLRTFGPQRVFTLRYGDRVVTVRESLYTQTIYNDRDFNACVVNRMVHQLEKDYSDPLRKALASVL